MSSDNLEVDEGDFPTEDEARAAAAANLEYTSTSEQGDEQPFVDDDTVTEAQARADLELRAFEEKLEDEAEQQALEQERDRYKQAMETMERTVDTLTDAEYLASQRLAEGSLLDITTSPIVDARVALGIEAVAYALLAINHTIKTNQTKTQEN